MGSKCSSICHSKSPQHQQYPPIHSYPIPNPIPNNDLNLIEPALSKPNLNPQPNNDPQPEKGKENNRSPLTKNNSAPTTQIKNNQNESKLIKNSLQKNSPFVIQEKKEGELNIHRSLSAYKLNKEDLTPSAATKRNMGTNFFRTKTVKYFQKDEKEITIIHSKQKKKTLKFRNSQYLNQFLIEKFELKVNFEQIPKKEGDTSLDNPPDISQILPAIIKEETPNKRSPSLPPLKFYFKTEFLQELLGSIYELNTAPLKKYELIYEEKTQEHKMKIYCTNYTTSEKNKVNIFRTEFMVPCHPEFFLNFMNNIPEQTKIDLLLDKYYIAEGSSESTNVIYLSYKKTIISSARDFIYLKHWGKLERNGQVFYCDTSRSIDHQDYPAFKNIVRGDIIYSGHVVSLGKDEKGNDISLCKLYSECDFKVNVPAFISKKFSKDEMKAYTERCISRIKELLKQNKK